MAEMKALRSVWEDIDGFLFDRGSPVALGVFRICVGLLSFIDLSLLLLDFDAWFTERGFIPLAALHQWFPPLDRGFTLFGQQRELPFTLPRPNLLSDVIDSRITMFFFVVAMVAALFTMLGLWTRLSTIALAIGLVTVQHRNPLILNGGDTVLRLSVLYLALAPSGAACSFDRLIGLWKGRLTGPASPVSLWPQRLIQINTALIYFTTVWLKWGGDLWRNGTATWYTSRLGEFSHFGYPQFLRDVPFVYAATYGTLATELALATLVFFKPYRKWALMAGLFMHGYIEYTMNIPLFSAAMASMYVCFYSGEEIVSWAHQVGTRLEAWRATILIPEGTHMRLGPKLALRAADPFRLLAVAPGGRATWGVKTSGRLPPSPKMALWARNPALIFLMVPGVWRKLATGAVQKVADIGKVEQDP